MFPESNSFLSTQVDISVVVCTYNRVEALMQRALASLLAQIILSEYRIEILVVDNASTDKTRQRVMNLMQMNTQYSIRYIFEEKQGLSYARNRGVAAARGDIIAFLDDDAEATSGWLQAIVEAYHRHPDAWAVGGRTLPVCEGAKPRWFRGHMLGYVGGHDYGPIEFLLSHKHGLQGANMSFRRKAFKEFGDFRTELGRAGQKKLSHEEGEFFRRMHNANKPIYYVPDALVYHYQAYSRFSFWSLVQVSYLNGVSESLEDYFHFNRKTILRRILTKLVIIAAAIFLAPFYYLTWNIDEAYFWFLRAMIHVGYIKISISQLLFGGILLETKADSKKSIFIS
jgi:glucosyl-dolichyl phosphate glucuronosyltransferase